MGRVSSMREDFKRPPSDILEAADFIANPTVDEILETEAAAYEHIAGKWGKVFA